MTAEERDFAREMAAAAVAPLEGHALEFRAAMEMATTNVAARIDPILRAALAAAEEKGRREADKLAESARQLIQCALMQRCTCGDECERCDATLEAIAWVEAALGERARSSGEGK